MISSCVFSLHNTLVNSFQGKPCSSRVRMPCKHLSSLLMLPMSAAAQFLLHPFISLSWKRPIPSATTHPNGPSMQPTGTQCFFYRLPSRFGQQIMQLCSALQKQFSAHVMNTFSDERPKVVVSFSRARRRQTYCVTLLCLALRHTQQPPKSSAPPPKPRPLPGLCVHS